MKRLYLTFLGLAVMTLVYASEKSVLNYRVINDKYVEAVNEDGSISAIPLDIKNNDFLKYQQWVNSGNKPLDKGTAFNPSPEILRAEWRLNHPEDLVETDTLNEDVNPDT